MRIEEGRRHKPKLNRSPRTRETTRERERPAVRAPRRSERSDSTSVSRRSSAGAVLDRDPSSVESDSAGAREVLRRQARTSTSLTGGVAGSDEPGDFSRLEAEESAAGAEGGPRFYTASAPAGESEPGQDGESEDVSVDPADYTPEQSAQLLEVQQQINESLETGPDGQPVVTNELLTTLQSQVEENPELAQGLWAANRSNVEAALGDLPEDPQERATALDALAQTHRRLPSGMQGEAIQSIVSSGAADRADIVQELATAQGTDSAFTRQLKEALPQDHPGVRAIEHVEETERITADLTESLESPDGDAQLAGQFQALIDHGSPAEVAATLNQLQANGQLENLLGKLTTHGFNVQDGREEGPESQALIDSLADTLSRAFQVAGDTELTDAFTDDLANLWGDGNTHLGVFLTSLESSVRDGHGADLAVATLDSMTGFLPNVGYDHHDDARHFFDRYSDNIIEAVGSNATELRDNLANLGPADEQLSHLVANWGPFMSKDELNSAVEEYMGNNPAYAGSEEALRTGLRDLAASERLGQIARDNQDGFGGPYFDENDIESIDESVATTTQGLSQAHRFPGSQAEIALQLEQQAAGVETNSLSRYADLAERFDIPSEDSDRFQEGISRVGVAHAAEAIATGDDARAYDLTRNLEFEGIDPNDARQIVEGLHQLIEASTSGDPTRVAGATGQLSELTEGLDIPELRVAAGALGGAGLITSGIELATDPSARALLDFAVSGTELTVGSFESSLSRLVSSQTIGTVGRIAGGVGSLFGVVDGLQAFADGDPVNGTLNLAGAAGGALLTFGSGAAATGVGLVLVAGAALGGLAYSQMQRVSHSNRFENQASKDFIDHAVDGQTSDSVLSKLINADGGQGNQVGIFIQESAAALGIPPDELLSTIASQDPGVIHQLVEKAHRVTDEDGLLDPSREDVDEWIEWVREYYSEEVPI